MGLMIWLAWHEDIVTGNHQETKVALPILRIVIIANNASGLPCQESYCPLALTVITRLIQSLFLYPLRGSCVD
jgi:hypothetical protein